MPFVWPDKGLKATELEGAKNHWYEIGAGPLAMPVRSMVEPGTLVRPYGCVVNIGRVAPLTMSE